MSPANSLRLVHSRPGLGIRLLSIAACAWGCASSSSKCADWSGNWYVVHGHQGGPGVFPVSQIGCEVTVTNGMSYTYYIARGNRLECRWSFDVKGSRCAMYYRNMTESAHNPASMVLHEATGPGQTTATSSAGDTTWRKQYTPACPQPSTNCYRHWAGSWKSSLGKFTVEQDGCRITKKQWNIGSGGSFERATHYTACDNMIVADKGIDVTMIMSKDGKKVTCPAPCAVVWTRRAPDPPKRPLPSCLPDGGCPISFADGTKPPCCDSGSVLVRDWFGACNGRIGQYGYPTSGSKCAKCIPKNEFCDGQRDKCCNGLTCVSQGISGSRCFPSGGKSFLSLR
jgi:hypothetical protein